MEQAYFHFLAVLGLRNEVLLSAPEVGILEVKVQVVFCAGYQQ